MALTDYIYFNTTDAIRKPEKFMPKREDVYKGEYTSCTGKLIADRIGWKYDDMTLEWDALSQSDVEILIGLTGIETLTFDDVDGNHTENIIRASAVSLKNRNTINGVTYWRDVSVDIKFIDTHNS